MVSKGCGYTINVQLHQYVCSASSGCGFMNDKLIAEPGLP